MTPETATRARRAALATLLAAVGALGGCMRGDLTLDVIATTEFNSVSYHLDPSGRLTVSAGGGLIEGQRDRTVHEGLLDPAAMDAFKKVVADSGILLAAPHGGGALVRGQAMRMEVRLGLWHNILQLYGRRLESVAVVVAEMNRHLPEKFRLDYRPPTAAEERDAFDRIME